MLTDILTKTGSNLLKTGIMVIISATVNDLLKTTTRDTMLTMTQDVRRIKNAYEARHQVEA